MRINDIYIIWFSLLITHQLLLYCLIIPIIYYASSQFVFIYWFLSFITYFNFGWLMQMPYIIPVLLLITHQHFLYYLIITIITLIISVCFYFTFFPHIFQFWLLMLMPYIIPVVLYITHEHIFYPFFPTICFCMDDANFTYHPTLASLIIYYSSTNFLILFFLINTFPPPLFMVDATFIFILVFTSSYFRSVWHPFSCFILCMVYFVLFVLPLESWAYTFSIM